MQRILARKFWVCHGSSVLASHRGTPHKLSLELDVEEGAPLPTEFLIFAAGVNVTENGTFNFTPSAAKQVMAAYQRHNIDLMLDLEHDSLDKATRQARADACDAMGWFRLALREDGSLWGEDVRWSAEGERRLRAKLQRFTSPAFFANEDLEPTLLINVALTSYPATHSNQPLVAASRRSAVDDERGVTAARTFAASFRGAKMDPEMIKAALKVLEEKDGDGALGMLTEMVAAAASGGEPAEAPDALAGSADTAPEDEEAQEMAAQLRVVTGKTGAEAVLALSSMKSELEKLLAERDAAEAAQRADAVATLVKLGVELPATAWADAEHREPCARLKTEPLADLKRRVELHAKAPRLADPSVTPGGADGLTADEEAVVTRLKMNDEQRARFVAIRASRRDI